MKKLLKQTLLSITLIGATVIAYADSSTNADGLAYMRPGQSIFFQFGMFYSPEYGNIISRYDTYGLAPGLVFGENTMTRMGYAYNFSNNLGVEVAFADNGVDFSGHRSGSTSTTDQEYDFDLYNVEVAAVLKNGFADLNSEIHAKFGGAYTYGKQTVSYHTSTGTPPGWPPNSTQYYQQFHAQGIAPLFGVGFSWSANKYIAYAFDYEHVFKPVVGNASYGDPLDSSMQATNMWLLGVTYHF